MPDRRLSTIGVTRERRPVHHTFPRLPPPHVSVSQAVSRNATYPLAIPSSVQTSAALELVATALVCTDSYCLFNLCISGNVTLRIGRFRINDPDDVAGGDGIGNEDAVGIV